MSKPAKILLGLATLWPIAYLFVFLAFFISMVIGMTNAPGDHGPAAFPTAFIVLFVLHGLTMLWLIGLLVFYIANVFRNDRVQKDMKVLWALVLFMGSMISMPIYWYLYVWREPAAEPVK